ncbi:hypothetical protein FB451DRAFT_1017825 [Mycena latifolia]|nr:hypothetical protein FB451DRAFT_1017825 [Mycena latifolia]
MDPLDLAKRVTRSQLPLPDSHLSLTRSPLKDARIAQRTYHMETPEPVPDDTDTDDEILLSPSKTRHLNSSRVNANSKRSASPPPQDEYSDSTAPQDGRELKRVKRDTGDADKRSKRDTEAGGSDIENTDTNIRATAPSSHARNLSEPAVGSSRRSTKPRSTSKQTPASPKGKGRARSVPVFPVLDLSNPPTTPWRRRARSRSPSKEHDSPKLQITFSSLASIPDEAAMPPPMVPSSTFVPDPAPAPEPPTIPVPVLVEPPATPIASSTYRHVFATPMSPLTPLPETPRPFQPRLDPDDSHMRTIGWGIDIAVSFKDIKASAMPPPPVPVPSSSSSTSSVAPTNAFQLMMASKSRGTAAKAKGKNKEKDKIAKPLASSSMPPPTALAPAMPSASTSAAAGSSKVPAKAPAPKEKGKGKGKEKAEEKPKEEKKVSLKAKMRPREKPKPLPLPIHVRLPEESDGERTSTPTAVSRPETPTTTIDAATVEPAMVVEEKPSTMPARRFSSPLPPELPAEPRLLPPDATTEDGEEKTVDVEMPVEQDLATGLPTGTTAPTDVVMDSVDEHIPPADVSMSGEQASDAQPPPEKESKGRPKSRVGKPRPLAPLPAPADRVTRSTSLKRKEAEGGAPTQKKLFSFGIAPATTAVGNPTKKQRMSDQASSHSQAGPSRSPSKIPMASPSKLSSFANPTKASAARSAVARTPAKNKPVSAAAGPSGSPSPTKNKLVRATSLFTARPPPSFTRTFTGPGGNPSSLQTLASALEKLRMPPPERPNTSMGFSRDDTDSTLAESTRSVDERSIGIGRPSGGLQRASTVASIASCSSSTSSITGDSSKPSTSAVPPPKTALVQRPLSAFMGSKNAAGASKLTIGTGSIMRGGPSIFGGAGRGRSAPKVSRHPGLPSVMGSPVKGGGGGDGDATMLEEDLMGEGEGVEAKDGVTERVTSPRGVTFDFSSAVQFEQSKKGKEKERLPEEWRKNAARRASMAGLDLSKSVSLPLKPIGLMGPPEAPLRSTSSSYPSSSDPSEGMRRSTRIANSAPTADTSIDDTAAVAEAQRPTATPIQPLTILKGCIVFVDIISEIGDDDSARSFITDMLKNLGARVLGSVGQTCTHIVYKNGLRSTYTRYKALADPKPLVVGMEWVVQSAEKRNHEDETPYLIDMDDMNTTATKRRKSMLPRLMSGGMDDSVDGDNSFDGSSSSMIMDDDLTPLERARLRKAGTLGI